ncbi:MAG: flagellar hook-associated protein FlgK [Devosia sp.]|nr:flagellar hook-associated protein FlgK [Devosia sp.]
MGLTTTLSNALSGLAVTQSSLDVLSRNVANSGTPGYHRQSVNIVDQTGTSSNYAVSTAVSRAFSQSLQNYYTTATSDSSSSSVAANYLNQLQTYLGTPGGSSSLDTVFGNFQTALSALTASPDDYSTRATVVSSAQTVASSLNQLTTSVQGLRQQANGQIQSDVDTLNQALSSLVKINGQLGNFNTDATSKAALLDQRDRLVTQVAGIVDVNVTYRDDGSVALATRSGVGLLDQKASTFSFTPVTNISATQQFSNSDAQNGVGTLTLTTPAGNTIDLVKQNVLQSGELKGLLDLRDKTLVQAQDQLDSVAAGLAQAFSTNTTDGTAATSGSASGLSIDLSNVRSGNDLLLNYTVGGTSQSVRVVRVDDTSKLPLDYTTNGVRTVGVSFANGAAGVASALQTALGSSLQISGSGSTLTVLNDGTSNTAVSTLQSRTTSTALQNAGLGLSLFVDGDNTDFTNSLDGQGEKLGFAGRISVNSAIQADNTKLVQDTSTTPIGDVARVNRLFDQLNSMTFSDPPNNSAGVGGQLSGTVSTLISQTMDYQGSVAAQAQSDDSANSDAMSAVTSRMTTDYGVNVNDEMARLVQLQAAYAANAHVVSVAQTLLQSLMQAMGG